MNVPLGLRIRLSALMFFEYALWGAWMFYLGLHLKKVLLLSEGEWAPYFMALAVASLIGPWLAGQVADRLVATEKVLAYSLLASGGLLVVFAVLRDPAAAFWVWFIFLVLYMPTIGLANSLSFHHLSDPDKQFGKIRVFGSIGWIAALCADALMLRLVGHDRTYVVFLIAAFFALAGGAFCFALPHTPPHKGPPERKAAVWHALKLMRMPSFAVFILVCLLLTVFFQFHFFLNGTFIVEARRSLVTAEGRRVHVQGSIPAMRAEADPGEAIDLADEAGNLKNPYAYDVEEDASGRYRIVTRAGHTVVVKNLIYFAEEQDGKGGVVKVEKAIRFEAEPDGFIRVRGEAVEAKVLGGLGLEDANVGWINGAASFTEFIALPLLAAVIGLLGLKGAFLFGVAMWILRFGIFSIGQPLWLVVASFMLHGFCFTFVYVVAQLYVNAVAASDIRASAQSLLNAVMLGIGALAGGWLGPTCVTWFGGNYGATFLIALAGSVLAAILFAVAFVHREEPKADAA